MNNENNEFFQGNEAAELRSLYRDLLRETAAVALPGDIRALRATIAESIAGGHYGRDRFGGNALIHYMRTALELCRRISADRNMIVALMLSSLCRSDYLSPEDVARDWDEDIAKIVRGLQKVSTLYNRAATVEDDNFRKLLLTFAEDIRVIIIMIVDRLTLMKAINHHPDEALVASTAKEAGLLYAPLAHRLGLYAIKGELEDMSLKYTNRDMYSRIAHKLNETKRSRDAYIADFIAPVKAALEKEGLNFEIKGRTKSIYSIWNKMKKQRVDVEGIYDLFAIRIIIDAPPERERSECWLAYSVVTNMYQPNPARLKDWLSIPKSNGYESLHITVMGPQGKWVEVQIRSRRMDEIAERGVAAHWRYKGIKSEQNLDTWMNRVREILEAADNDPLNLMKNLKMDIYDKEVFVFTPKGDLYRLPSGATVLDFAFMVHSRLGCTCTGGKVNGRTRKINHRLSNGDTVEIMTSANQVPKQDWLGFVVTSKARTKIRQTLNEQANRSAELGREMLQRRFKNRKIEIDEGILSKLIKKLGYKTSTDFFNAIADESLEVNRVAVEYDMIDRPAESTENRSAEEFSLQTTPDKDEDGGTDTLVIGEGVKGLNYRMSRCCNPIYGDQVFGFIASDGAIKIHRADCPNAANMRRRYPYRFIPVRWSGKLGTQFAATLKIVGVDDIGIVTNVSSIINKEKDCSLRSIAIDSHDGIFHGTLVVGVVNTESLASLIRKIKTVKGVKNVERSN